MRVLKILVSTLQDKLCSVGLGLESVDNVDTLQDKLCHMGLDLESVYNIKPESLKQKRAKNQVINIIIAFNYLYALITYFLLFLL